jgi:hypothetical protein
MAGGQIYSGGRPFFKGGQRFKNFVTFNKTVTGIADDVATTIFTINVPNPPTGSYASACITVTMMTILGAGGGVAVGETATVVSSVIVVTRTPGLAAVIGIASLINATSAAVAGASTSVAATLTNVAVAGANTAAQTFAIQTTIDDDSNSATNDIAVVYVQCQNAGLGVTFS